MLAGKFPINKTTARNWLRSIMAALALLSLPSIAMGEESMNSRQLVCQTIEEAAATNGLPYGFLARLLWVESGFRNSATSPAGAEGMAQFMPQTAAEQGLANPRDPRAAIRYAARFLAALNRQYGNLGLAAAAYNAGTARVTKWLQNYSELPLETRVYVHAVTGQTIEDWSGRRGGVVFTARSSDLAERDCLSFGAGHAALAALPPRLRAWQVRLDTQLAGASVFGTISIGADPLGSAPMSRSPNPIRLPGAESICEALRARGAVCQVFGP